jgi:hypothetical protein
MIDNYEEIMWNYRAIVQLQAQIDELTEKVNKMTRVDVKDSPGTIMETEVNQS